MKTEPNFQMVLPKDLRDALLVLPRSMSWRLPLICMLIGAGLALSLASAFLQTPLLGWSFPVALLLTWLLGCATKRRDEELLRRVIGESEHDA